MNVKCNGITTRKHSKLRVFYPSIPVSVSTHVDILYSECILNE